MIESFVLYAAKGADLLICACAVLHMNSMTPQSSKCEMITWWLAGVVAFADFCFAPHWDASDALMNVAFAALAFEMTRHHWAVPRLCEFKDRRRKGMSC